MVNKILHTIQNNLIPKTLLLLKRDKQYKYEAKKIPNTQSDAGTYNPIKKLNGTSKHMATKAMMQTVLKILSSKENNFGSPISLLLFSSFPRISTINNEGFKNNKLNHIKAKEKMIFIKTYD